jgi:hypothetical protein
MPRLKGNKFPVNDLIAEVPNQKYSQEIGNCILKGRFGDKELRKVLQPVLSLLQDCARVALKEKDLPLGFTLVDNTNCWIVSAFHAASTIEEYAKVVGNLDAPDVAERFSIFIALQHMLCNEVLVNLNSVLSYLTQPEVTKILKLSSSNEVQKVFDHCFPNLVNARHFASHEYSRVLGKKYDPKTRKDVRSDLDLSSIQRALQFWTCMTVGEGRDDKFDFHFDTPRFFKLAKELNELLEK